MNYRKYYQITTGVVIDDNFHVHHLNGDRKNNHISNLVAIPMKLHKNFHSAQVQVEYFLQDLKENRCFKLFKKYIEILNKYSKLRNEIFEYEMIRDSYVYKNTDIEIYDGLGLNNFSKTLI